MKPISRRTGEYFVSHTVSTGFGQTIRVRENVSTGRAVWNYKNKKSITGFIYRTEDDQFFVCNNAADVVILKSFKRKRSPSLYNGIYADTPIRKYA